MLNITKIKHKKKYIVLLVLIMIIFSIGYYYFVFPRINVKIRIDIFGPPLPFGPLIIIGLKISNTGNVELHDVNITLLLTDITINKTLLNEQTEIKTLKPWYIFTENEINYTFKIFDATADQLHTYNITLMLSFTSVKGDKSYYFVDIYDGYEKAKETYYHEITE